MVSWLGSSWETFCLLCRTATLVKCNLLDLQLENSRAFVREQSCGDREDIYADAGVPLASCQLLLVLFHAHGHSHRGWDGHSNGGEHYGVRAEAGATSVFPRGIQS